MDERDAFFDSKADTLTSSKTQNYDFNDKWFVTLRLIIFRGKCISMQKLAFEGLLQAWLPGVSADRGLQLWSCSGWAAVWPSLVLPPCIPSSSAPSSIPPPECEKSRADTTGRSKMHLGNLVICLISKNCVCMYLYWGSEVETGQESCLLKETVLTNIRQVQLLECFLSYRKLWCGFPGKYLDLTTSVFT